MATEGTITIQQPTDAQLLQAPGSTITGTDLPDILNGTNGNDTIDALGGDDTIFGSLGSDRINGGAGIDTVDYSRLGVPIILFPKGVVGNGDPQTSLIQNIETIIGAQGQPNTIDGSSGSGGASFDINLGANRLTVNNVPQLGTLNFTVRNFVNVNGTPNNDSIIGNGGANTINGFGGNDAIAGGGGNDTLSGTDGSARGIGELDTLTGGAGTDKYILGNAEGAYYKSQGDGDFARIRGFEPGEQIQLGAGDTYQVAPGNFSFQVFVTTGGVRDLIADVQLNRVRFNASSSINAVDSLLPNVPEGDFTLASGQTLGAFVGA